MTIVFNDQIISIGEILNKTIHDTTFKEIISLCFHSVIIISNKSDNPCYVQWKNLFDEFENQFKKQNNVGWPQITVINNDYYKRIDISVINKQFIESTNIFMLLFRLLYIENFKISHILKSNKYYEILDHKLNNGNNEKVKKISLDIIFELLKIYLIYYKKIYNNHGYFEYQLCNIILNNL